MKVHSNAFKEQLKTLGREVKTIISYNNVTLEEELYSVTPHYTANLLKSIMKQLDIVSSVDIPKETIISLQIGIKVNDEFEMLDYGNYVVYSTEKQEDTNTYKIIAYDKMLYSMKEYEDLGVTYPISLKNYLIALGNKIGLEVEDTTFANESRTIPAELYLGLNYTYRDVLDEIAEATGSNIIINSNDRIEVKYFTQTNDIIDEEFLKDINVKFGEKYGAINTIVLSRSAESDNIYYPSPLPENPIEIKIKDNQLMNDNNRVDYLPELYQKLNGLEFYLNDFNSTGILYYEPCDIYNVRIGENTYKCAMLNDEIDITTGLKEIVYTDMPEQSETDYTKADKTDQRINQTYLIVDKQNQQIESVISNVTEQNEKIVRVTQTVDELNSKISDIADITTSQESSYARVTFTNINQSEPIRVEIRPLGTNISYLYPRDNLYPSDTLFMPDRILRFTNTTTSEVFDYELPTDILYYDSNNYDEFILDYDSQTCIVNKKVGYNADGTTYVLSNPQTVTYTYPTIELTDGDYTVSLPGYSSAYLFVRLMAQNIYTTQFATRAEVRSEISQTATNINLSVDNKLSNYSTTTQMNSAISLSANNVLTSVSNTYATKTELGNTETTLRGELEVTAGQIRLEVGEKLDEEDFTGANIILAINKGISGATINADKIDLTGYVTINSLKTAGQTVINGSNITTGTIKSGNYKSGETGTSINLSTGVIDTKNFKVNSTGNITATGGTIGGWTLASNRLSSGSSSSYVGLDSNSSNTYAIWAGNGTASSAPFRVARDGTLTATNANIAGTITSSNATITGGTIELITTAESYYDAMFKLKYGDIRTFLAADRMEFFDGHGTSIAMNLAGDYMGNGLFTIISPDIDFEVATDKVWTTGNIEAQDFVRTSLAEKKKNFEKFNNALDIIKNTDIYKYHYKNKENNSKKDIGLVIGNDFKYSQELTNNDNNAVSISNVAFVCMKAIQEQQEIIENLEARIVELEGVR